MQHSFDIIIAQKYGVNVAIFLNNLAFWVQRNQLNNKHLHEGYSWTFNTQEAFTSLFPYWSRQNFRTVIKDCVKHGLILVGNFNEIKYDRTNWYTLSDLGLSLFPILKQNTDDKKESETLGWNQPSDWSDSSNSLVSSNQPIPDINTDINTDKIKSLCASNDAQANSESHFDKFWDIYPRKKDKRRAEQVWNTKRYDKIAQSIIKDIKNRIANDTQWQNEQFIPHPSTYLRNKRWEDDVTLKMQEVKKETGIERALRMCRS